MLQEAHFTKENENIIEAEWGFKCIFSNCSSQSCGVALLFNNNFQFVIKNTVSFGSCGKMISEKIQTWKVTHNERQVMAFSQVS